jgi:ribosomal protein S19
MSRSAWKLPYISLLFFQNRFLKDKKSFNVRLRNSIIPSIFISKKINISIFNGIWYLALEFSNSMRGFKFGEFSNPKRTDTQTHIKKKIKKKSRGEKRK